MPRTFDKLAFVDIETTGTSSFRDRIIEIAILRLENGILVDSFVSLVNPGCRLSPFISQFTGISEKDIESAPTFAEVKEKVEEILDGAIFVAHNARFDYSFIKRHLKHFGSLYTAPTLCTVKLSRQLFPKYHHHDLDSLINRFNFSCPNRHRAHDDAKVLIDFYNYIHANLPSQKLEKAINQLLQKPSLPPAINFDLINSLDQSPGVYIFYDKTNLPLYIGKSKNLKTRILSHFQNDVNSEKELSLSREIADIKTISTAGELGALLLESQLIKELQPTKNRLLRHSKKMILAKQTTDQNGYYTVSLEAVNRISLKDTENLLAVFKNQKQAVSTLFQIAKEKQLCPKILGLDKSKNACFNYHLNLCLGACVNQENPLFYNIRFLNSFSKKIQPWPFSGPIIITETNPDNGLTDKFLIDSWCYLGHLQSGENSDNTTSRHPEFNYDTYKILHRFINSTANQSLITPFTASSNSFEE